MRNGSVKWLALFVLLTMIAALVLLVAGCAQMPPRSIYVVMPKPPCGPGPDVRLVRFVDTLLPLTACVQAAGREDAAATVLLTLLGMPTVACAITVYEGPGHLGAATIYAPISPTPTQLMTAALTMHSPDDVLLHEIGHAFSKDHLGCRNREGAKP